MEIQFKDMVVEVPDADQDGPHYFRLNGLFWEVWNRDKSLCKLHGFDVQRGRFRLDRCVSSVCAVW